MRSGYINHINGRSLDAGIRGSYWPSTAASRVWSKAGLGVYFFVFNPEDIYPSYGPYERWLGRSLRWLGGRGVNHSNDSLDHPTGEHYLRQIQGSMRYVLLRHCCP